MDGIFILVAILWVACTIEVRGLNQIFAGGVDI